MRSPINSPRGMRSPRRGGYDFDDFQSPRGGFSEYDMTSMKSDDYQRYGRRKKSTWKEFMIRALMVVITALILFVTVKLLIYVQFPQPFQDSYILTEDMHLNFVKQMLYEYGQ